MYKLLVVDDEFNIRDGIVTAVPWETCDVVVSGEAENGVQALERVRETKPDIVISDITMDEMDGLEFVEHLKQLHPEVKVIILSGYDEFEYAKRALQLKVFSYLLKPVSPEELMTTVRKVIAEIQAETQLKERITSLETEIKINRELYLDRLLHDLTEGNITDRKELDERLTPLDMQLDSKQFCALVVALDGYHEIKEQSGMARVRLLMHQLEQLYRDLFGKHYGVWTYAGAAGQLVTILGGSGTGMGAHGLQSFLEHYRNETRRILGVTATIAIGGLITDILTLSRSYAQAIKALDYRIISGPDSIIHIDDVNAINSDQFIYPHDLGNAILNVLAEGTDAEIKMTITAFFRELEKRNCMKEHLRIAVMELFSVIARKFMDLGLDIHAYYDRDLMDPYKVLERFDTMDAVQNWLANIVLHSSSELRQKRLSSVKSVVARVQNYIGSNYMNPDISLNSIAEHVYLNAAYLSKLYKKETGENYLEFLTRLRIEKAKLMLRTTNTRTADIGSAVGYPNPQYFATLFRKTVGMTPVEFRETK